MDIKPMTQKEVKEAIKRAKKEIQEAIIKAEALYNSSALNHVYNITKNIKQ
jgi:hypothetical protein